MPSKIKRLDSKRKSTKRGTVPSINLSLSDHWSFTFIGNRLSFYKDYYGTCTGTTHTLRANAAGASMSIWALPPTGWKLVASKTSIIAGTTLTVSKSKISSLGGSGQTQLRGYVTASSGTNSPIDSCYSHGGLIS